MNSRYYRDHQRTCNILIMVTYLMSSKLIYPLIGLGNIELIGYNKAGLMCNLGPSVSTMEPFAKMLSLI